MPLVPLPRMAPFRKENDPRLYTGREKVDESKQQFLWLETRKFCSAGFRPWTGELGRVARRCGLTHGNRMNEGGEPLLTRASEARVLLPF